MNTAPGRIETFPKEFQHGLLFAVTPDNKCVGVQLFSNDGQSNGSRNVRLDDYIDQSVKRAIDLKLSVENGSCDIERNGEIILSSSKYTDSVSLIRSQSKEIEQIRLIECENRFIDLGKVMIRSVQTGKCEMLICEICLAEIYLLSKQLLTPLMLKKNPELVRAVSKLCRFANSNIRQPGEACSKIRSYANKTFSSFKTMMGFANATNEEFLQWFNESVKLFCELTANISDDEKRLLTEDPEKSLAMRVVA